MSAADLESADQPQAAVPVSGDIVSDDYVANMHELSRLIRDTGALGFYRRDDGAFVVVVPSSGSSSFTVEKAAHLGIEVLIEARDIEPQEVDAIKQHVTARHDAPDARTYTFAPAFDARLGRVRIFTNAPREIFSDILGDFPGLVDYEYANLSRSTRTADVEPHWGGAKLAVSGQPWKCTSGFSVLNTNGNDRMVTAGHCFTLGQAIVSPSGTTFGNVKKRDNYPANDFELIGETGGGIVMGAAIYIGGSTGVRALVYGAEGALFDTAYCFSGATQTERCIQYMI